MGSLSPTHWLIVIGVLVLLFGAKRLPDAARSLGRSARILKTEITDTGDDGDKAAQATPPDPAPVLAPPVAEQPARPQPDPSPTPPPNRSPTPPTRLRLRVGLVLRRRGARAPLRVPAWSVRAAACSI